MTKPFEPQNLKEDRVLQHDRQLACCRFSPDGERLFAAGFDGQLHRWHLGEDRHDAFPAPGGWIESMLLHPDGQRLFTADSWGQVRCWPSAGQSLAPHWTVENANRSWLRKLAVSPDGKQFATCGNDRMARVFSADDGGLIREFGGHEFCVQSVAFHRDGHSLVSGDQHGVVKHWNLADGKCQRDLDASKLFKVFHQYEQGGVRSMIFDPEFKTLYCAGFEGINANQAHGTPMVVALDWETGEQTLTMTPSQEFKGPILDLAFHPAGFLVGAGSSEGGGVLWFWKPGETQECHLIKNPTSFRGLDLTGDGLRFAAAAFGDRGGQRGGNGRRLDKDGQYVGFAGNIVLYSAHNEPANESPANESQANASPANETPAN